MRLCCPRHETSHVIATESRGSGPPPELPSRLSPAGSDLHQTQPDARPEWVAPRPLIQLAHGSETPGMQARTRQKDWIGGVQSGLSKGAAYPETTLEVKAQARANRPTDSHGAHSATESPFAARSWGRSARDGAACSMPQPALVYFVEIVYNNCGGSLRGSRALKATPLQSPTMLLVEELGAS